MTETNRTAAQSEDVQGAISEGCTVVSMDRSGRGVQDVSVGSRVVARAVRRRPRSELLCGTGALNSLFQHQRWRLSPDSWRYCRLPGDATVGDSCLMRVVHAQLGWFDGSKTEAAGPLAPKASADRVQSYAQRGLPLPMRWQSLRAMAAVGGRCDPAAARST
jgi:hypothetical protein